MLLAISAHFAACTIAVYAARYSTSLGYAIAFASICASLTYGFSTIR